MTPQDSDISGDDQWTELCIHWVDWFPMWVCVCISL